MACPTDTVSVLPILSWGEDTVRGNETGDRPLRLRAVGDVEEAVQVLESDLGALVHEVQEGIVKCVSSLIIISPCIMKTYTEYNLQCTCGTYLFWCTES